MVKLKTKVKSKIVISGGSGRFGNIIKKVKTRHKLYFPSKKQLNILDIKSIEKYLKKTKPNIFIHLAALSRPINLHEKDIRKSISLNIIGTANVVNVCSKLNIKIIYFSTTSVYPGTKGDYKETDSLKPINNYGLSKLGGEASVMLYKNSLILRVCMTEEPFIHKKAFYDVFTNFEYHKEIANILFKLLNIKGIVNLGGKSQTVYNFTKSKKIKTKKISAKKIMGNKYPLKQDMNLNKLKSILKKNKYRSILFK